MQPIQPQRVASDVARNLGEEIQRLDAAAAFILSNLHDEEARALPRSNNYAFFLYDRLRLVAWSGNDFVPTAASVVENFDIKLLKAGNGNYLAKRWKVSNTRFLVGIIPLIRNYTITNDYLKTAWNDRILPSPNFDILEPDANLGIEKIRMDKIYRESG